MELLDGDPHVRFQYGREDIVSLCNLAPSGHHNHAYAENTLATDTRTSTCTEDSHKFVHTVIH